MRNWRWIALAAVTMAGPALAADHDMKFWNLTAETVNELYLAPAGTTEWSANQCLNDVEDKTVEALKKKYNVVGLPTVVLLDKDGKEQARFNELVKPERMVDALRKVR